MKTALTTHERIQRIFDHQPADRVPIVEQLWPATRERWHREGLPEDTDPAAYFDLDHIAGIGVDNSPRFPERTIEETDAYRIRTSRWGATQKNWKHQASTPDFLDFSVKTRDDWEAAKQRMTVESDRVDWRRLQREYPRWRENGAWIFGQGWFGFDVTHAWFIGTERLLFALAEDPDWCYDIFTTQQELNLALLDMVWDAGYRFDALRWPDDMAYKYNQFFSLRTYRKILKPIHRRAIDWAHEKGIPACLHTDGDINPFVPELLEMGLDYLNPIEVKAGMDPLQLKRDHGEELVLHGGFDALLWSEGADAVDEAVRRMLPSLMENGGYIFATDHSVPSCVSLSDFARIVEVVKRIGAYE